MPGVRVTLLSSERSPAGVRPSIDRREHYLVPAVIGPRCQAPAEVLQGPGTLADTCGGGSSKAADGQGGQAACCRAHAMGRGYSGSMAEARSVRDATVFPSRNDLLYKAKIANIKLAKKEKEKENKFCQAQLKYRILSLENILTMLVTWIQ